MTTDWTQVRSAGISADALEGLLQRYWSPVYAFLRRSGRTCEEAADLTQGFIADVVLKRHLFQRADPEKGRFRTYLLTALRNYLIDDHRAPTVPTVTVDLGEFGFAEPDERDEPDRAFDRQWAATVLGTALERLESECRAEGLDRHWHVFESRALGPALHNREPTPYEHLAGAVAAKGTDEIYNLLYTVKRKFREVLREVVAETVDDPADVEHELAQLRGYLGVLAEG